MNQYSASDNSLLNGHFRSAHNTIMGNLYNIINNLHRRSLKMNQYFASDISLLDGQFKAAYVTIMGNIMNSTASIEERETLLIEVLNKLIYAQSKGLPIESIIDETIMPYCLDFIAQKPAPQIEEEKTEKTEIAKKNPPLPIFFMTFAITLSTIIYSLLNIKDFSLGQINIVPEFIIIPSSIIVLSLLYYGVLVAKQNGNNVAVVIYLVLAPLYLGIVSYLIVSRPLYFCTVLGSLSLYIVSSLLIILWTISIIVFVYRKSIQKKKA